MFRKGKVKEIRTCQSRGTQNLLNLKSGGVSEDGGWVGEPRGVASVAPEEIADLVLYYIIKYLNISSYEFKCFIHILA
jgi:hypothetical protein